MTRFKAIYQTCDGHRFASFPGHPVPFMGCTYGAKYCSPFKCPKIVEKGINMVYHYKETKYGFEYGAAVVTRLASDETAGNYLSVRTNREIMEIRVTPGGRINVIEHRKRRKGDDIIFDDD